jgi:hypothetical protein
VRQRLEPIAKALWPIWTGTRCGLGGHRGYAKAYQYEFLRLPHRLRHPRACRGPLGCGTPAMTKQASLISRTILITTGEEQLLVLEIALDCPDCGQHAFRIAGHHLRTLRQLLTSVIDANPNLVGTEDHAQIVEQFSWQGSPGDPSNT